MTNSLTGPNRSHAEKRSRSEGPGALARVLLVDQEAARQARRGKLLRAGY
jgi:hypothetical protein